MRRLIEHLPVLNYMRRLSTIEQKNLISTAPKDLLITLSEIALNIISKNIPLTRLQIEKLRKFEKDIVSLSQKKHSLAKRRKILRGKGLVKNLLDVTIPPLMVSLARKKQSKSKKDVGRQEMG